MRSWFKQKRAGLWYRWQNLRYGIWFIKSASYQIPKKIWIDGSFRTFRFLNADSDGFLYEFREICIEDIYQLQLLNKKLRIRTVVDVGANQGLFIIAARKFLSQARIQAYEPNPALSEILMQNGSNCHAEIFMEAVSDEDGLMQLQFAESDLHTQAFKSTSGGISATSFAKVISRAGDYIDLLKLDCEGGEWPLLDHPGVWKNVRAFTMEYHLWARPGQSYSDLEKLVTSMGYSILYHLPLSEHFGILTGYRPDKLSKQAISQQN